MRATRILLKEGGSLNQKFCFFVWKMSHIKSCAEQTGATKRITDGGLELEALGKFFWKRKTAISTAFGLHFARY